MRVLVVGASGRLGRQVVAALAARGHSVRGTSRDGDRVPEPAGPVAAELLDMESLHTACTGKQAVVMAAGAPLSLVPMPGHPGFHAVDTVGTLNLLNAARGAGVSKFVYVSVFSPEGFKGGPYVAAHRKAAEAVRQSGLKHAIIQPTGFFSTFDTYLRLARLGVIPEIGDGTARTNPIHERDLAEVVAEAVEGKEGDIPVGGPEVLARREIALEAFEAAGRKPRIVRMPRVVLRANRRVVRLVDRRLAELFTFLDAVSRVDAVAPPHGSERLAEHFRQRAAGGSGGMERKEEGKRGRKEEDPH